MALVDANYIFCWVDVDRNASCSDAQAFQHSELRETLEDGTINFPGPEPLPHNVEPVPYYILGDDAFPMKTWLMKPFAARWLNHEEQVFNYRLSWARRVVKNAFGIRCATIRRLLNLISIVLGFTHTFRLKLQKHNSTHLAAVHHLTEPPNHSL